MPAITLYQLPGARGLSLSPFCNKVHWALRLKGLLYRTETVLVPRRVSATGKVPVLAYDGERVHDSTTILRFLEARHPAPALVPADARLAAHAHVLEEWADEAFSPLAAYYRFADPAGLDVLAAVALPTVPRAAALAALRVVRAALLRRYGAVAARGALHARGELDANLDAIDALARGREWLVGDAPSVADLAVAAQLETFTVGTSPEALAALRARPAASALLERVMERAGRVA